MRLFKAETTEERDARYARGEFIIPAHNLETIQNKLAKLNKRAAKLGCAPITLAVGEHEDEPILEREEAPPYKWLPTGRMRRWLHVKVTGEAPKLNGWEFVAALDVLEGGTVIRAVPGYGVPVEYRKAEPHCDHCQKVRNRRTHYLLRNDYFQHKMVGSACIKDFLGHVSPEALVKGAEWLMSAEDLMEAAEDSEWGGGGGASYGLITEDYLAWVIVAIETCGWLSRSAARNIDKTATSDIALNFQDPKARRQMKNPPPDPTEAQRAEAAEVHEWVIALVERPNLSDYEHNLAVAGAGEVTRWNHSGIVASAVVAFRREREREIKRRERAVARPKSTGYIGEVGKRLEIDATVTWLGSTESNWGTTTIVKLMDAEGRMAVWFSSRALPLGPNNEVIGQGTKLKLKATVKEHKDYKGEPETVITRAKIVVISNPVTEVAA